MSSNRDEKVDENCNIRVTKNGPYLVSGNIPLFYMTIECDGQGTPLRWIKGRRLTTTHSYLLCRCGQSRNKPFCDSSHLKVNFDGTETSINEPYEKMAQVIEGPDLTLKDAVLLCASARFCHRGGDIWDVIHKTKDPKAMKNVVENSADCPSGRLLVLDKKTGLRMEPKIAKSIGVVEDPSKGVSGPFWIRGGIPIFSESGKLYEVRNRVTICRCGKSSNKPFCDSSHYPEEDREVK